VEVIINYLRPGKGILRYIEPLVDDDQKRIKTCNTLTPAFSQKWCEEVWGQNGCIPPGILIGPVVKYLFYKEWFSVMQLLAHDRNHLGHYVDIDTPIRKSNGEYHLTDLFLDLWLTPDPILSNWTEMSSRKDFGRGCLHPTSIKKPIRFSKH
jgi:hypothetical protein